MEVVATVDDAGLHDNVVTQALAGTGKCLRDDEPGCRSETGGRRPGELSKHLPLAGEAADVSSEDEHFLPRHDKPPSLFYFGS